MNKVISIIVAIILIGGIAGYLYSKNKPFHITFFKLKNDRICNILQDQSSKDNCYLNMALSKKDCDKIQNQEIKNYCYSDVAWRNLPQHSPYGDKCQVDSDCVCKSPKGCMDCCGGVGEAWRCVNNKCELGLSDWRIRNAIEL
ncbi:MAG: hypothetical protein NTW73_02415 [Candidatus Parcubacteria bacterium]|nr:hypothetical protein [Candidatus Parcubacteria bacterium]